MRNRGDLEDMEKKLGWVLRIGVALSTAAMAAGLVTSLALGSGAVSHDLLAVGILTLIATPFARVAVSTVLYVLRRDWLFVALTLVVLGELIASIVAALRG